MRSSIKPMGTAPEISYLNRAIYAMNLSLPDPLSILETTGRNGNTNQITQIRFALSDEVIKHLMKLSNMNGVSGSFTVC